jgi:spore cortex biosynthesis protein YabQ
MLEISIEQQLVVFLLLIVLGFISGLLFDLLRGCGKGFEFSKSIIFLTDLVFCILFTLVVSRVLYRLNWGELRFYVFLALLLGIIFYYGLCSRFVYHIAKHFSKIIYRKALNLQKRWQGFTKKSRIVFYKGYTSLNNLFRKDE